MRIFSEWVIRWVWLAGRSQVVIWLILALLAGFGIVLAATQGTIAMTEYPAPEIEDSAPDLKLPSGQALTDTQRARLALYDWESHVGEGLGVWICVDNQRFYIVSNYKIIWETKCSTAAKGTGFKRNSFQTPLGWHSVAEKIGDGKPIGQVFREKRPTSEVWKPGQTVKEDLVLTRILALRGEEPGRNQGGDVDSFDRKIYIHGTNDEARIGQPVSHGCVRLTNADVVEAYDRIPQGTWVLITE